MIRLFVGFRVPETLRMSLSALGGGVPGARWVQPENYHLTLRFIGEVEEGVAEDIDMTLAAIAAPSFAVEIAGIGQFGKGSKARALWAGIVPSAALNHLQAKVEAAIVGAGLPDEQRKFTPHITLARLKAAPADRVERFVVDNAGFRAGPMPVDRFTLFSSFLSSSGAIYTPEVDYDLQ
jgi:2'-5' RNA ligase